MAYLHQLIDIFLHLDVYLNDKAAAFGPWLYLILFLILFCETGLVVTPILPGDSLLFAVGALAAMDNSSLSLPLLMILLVAAAVLGDWVNYHIGKHVGPKVFRSERSRLLNKKHLIETQQFYERYGAITIVLARFMPIIRTFAPFVAGIGKMEYRKFAFYNFSGGVAWVLSFLLGGYFFGNTPIVKRNFHIVIIAIVVISVLPAIIKFLLSRRKPSSETNSPMEYHVPVEEAV
jgi:membrane-associated protein